MTMAMELNPGLLDRIKVTNANNPFGKNVRPLAQMGDTDLEDPHNPILNQFFHQIAKGSNFRFQYLVINLQHFHCHCFPKQNAFLNTSAASTMRDVQVILQIVST